MLSFSVGKAIEFAISTDCADHLEGVTREAALRWTTQGDFLDRYYALMRSSPKGVDFDPSKPMSYCIMSPEVARELN